MVLFQLVASLLFSVSFAQEPVESQPVYQTPSPRVGEISPADQERVRTRVNTLDMTSFSFGPAWASDINNDDLFYSLHLGRNWEVHTNAEIRLNLEAAFASKDEGNWLSGTVGAGWLVSVDNISPVIGAEFGYGYAHAEGLTDPSGFVIGAFFGARFFRTATAQMSLEGFLQTILDDHSPMIGGVRLGILF